MTEPEEGAFRLLRGASGGATTAATATATAKKKKKEEEELETKKTPALPRRRRRGGSRARWTRPDRNWWGRESESVRVKERTAKKNEKNENEDFTLDSIIE